MDAPGARAPRERVAVVLFNLGGPDSPESIEPFLFNLFNDPAIIGAPGPVRWLIAKLISRRRAPEKQTDYGYMGGKSPLLDLTTDQATALDKALAADPAIEVRSFIAMRYWHPFAAETVSQIVDWKPDRIVVLPLYPQFSTATTGSSILDFADNAAKAGLRVPLTTICCYPTEPDFIEAHAALVRQTLAKARGPARVLFSAHGLPERLIARGDPYQWQVEQTVAAVAKAAKLDDHVVCYQSRVGPLKWIGPSTEDEIVRAAKDGRSIVLVPIAFVSEHIETLVELDIEYKEIADEHGVAEYLRVPALNTHALYIKSLAGLVRRAATHGGPCSHTGTRLCPANRRQCPAAAGVAQQETAFTEAA